jgi:hypothetical protein
MLAQQQNIFDNAGFAGGDDAFLQYVRFGVTDESEVDNETLTGGW